MFSLLLFMFCFFLGSIAMFFYSIKKRESQFRNLNEEHAQLRVLMRAMESRLDNIEKYLASCPGIVSTAARQEGAEAGCEDASDMDHKNQENDPLLHLSFEDPDKIEGIKRDPNLELLLDPQNEKREN